MSSAASTSSRFALQSIYHPSQTNPTQIDTRYIKTPETVSIVPITNADNIDFGNYTAADLGLDDFYTSSLWNYCSGKISGDKWEFTECGKPSASYAFDPFKILDEGDKEIDFPDSIHKVNKAVGAASRVMTAMYVMGLVSSIVTFAVGWFGLLSRWGSCVTTILADVCCLPVPFPRVQH